MIGLFHRPMHADQVIARKASGTVILLNLDSGHYYSLDEVGSRVWELCDGARTVPEIVSRICQEYDAATDRVEQDVSELLAELAKEKLVHIGEPAAPSAPQTQ